MFCQIFPLISDVTMCDKFPEDPGDDDLSKSQISRPQLLSSLEMRNVLSGLGNESMADNTDNTEDEEEDEEEESEFQKVLAEIPDLEGDYSELSLGFNEELCLGNQVFHQDNSQQTLNTPPATDILQPESEKSSTSADAKEEKKTLVEKVVKFVETESSQNPSNIPNPAENSSLSEASSSAARNAGLTVSFPPPVPIHKGDLIEFLVGDRTWFLVEVTGRGKIGGKNQNYLNVRYSDKSEGGVFIDQHEWRIVRRREVGPLEDAEDVARPVSARLHRVTVDLASSCEAGIHILLSITKFT